jgi:hypothetical protein
MRTLDLRVIDLSAMGILAYSPDHESLVDASPGSRGHSHYTGLLLMRTLDGNHHVFFVVWLYDSKAPPAASRGAGK